MDQLVQSILANAFICELVAQNPNDESAEKLLERIREEKEKTFAKSKISKFEKIKEMKGTRMT